MLITLIVAAWLVCGLFGSRDWYRRYSKWSFNHCAKEYRYSHRYHNAVADCEDLNSRYFVALFGILAGPTAFGILLIASLLDSFYNAPTRDEKRELQAEHNRKELENAKRVLLDAGISLDKIEVKA